MNSNETFLQLLDVAQLRSGKNLKEIAQAIECHPTYISRIRTGKQNAGPSVTMALRRFVEDLKPGETKNNPPAQSRGLSALYRTAEKFGLDPDELLENLVMKYGWGEAEFMKDAAEKSQPQNEPSKATREAVRVARAIVGVPALKKV